MDSISNFKNFITIGTTGNLNTNQISDNNEHLFSFTH